MGQGGTLSLGRAPHQAPRGGGGHSPAPTPRGPGRPSSSSAHPLADRQLQLLRAVDEVEVCGPCDLFSPTLHPFQALLLERMNTSWDLGDAKESLMICMLQQARRTLTRGWQRVLSCHLQL